MRETNAKMAKVAAIMLEKASECLELARAEDASAIEQHENALRQRKDADRLNSSAKKLTQLGYALESEAITLRGVLDVNS